MINKNGVPVSAAAKRSRFKLLFQFSLIGLAFVAVFAFFYSCSRNANKLDLDDVNIIQDDTPSDDAPVVVFETTMGTYKAVLYPEQAPEYCEYFTGLVNDGYYDDTYIFAVENGVYFMGGNKTNDGVTNDDTDTTNCEQELSPDLWPFKGSLIAYGDEDGFFNKKTLAGSRILFVNSVEFTDDFKTQLEEADGNPDLVSAFEEKGGIPNFAQQYTIFGQVYDGMDVYEEICGVEVADSDTKQPMNEIKFTKVYMSTYGQNKPTATDANANSSQAESSSLADSSATE